MSNVEYSIWGTKSKLTADQNRELTLDLFPKFEGAYIPREVLESNEISDSAKILFGILYSLKPGQYSLSELGGLYYKSSRGVASAKRELMKKDLLYERYRGNPITKMSMRKYELFCPDKRVGEDYVPTFLDNDLDKLKEMIERFQWE